jgi:hypothetical protein
MAIKVKLLANTSGIIIKPAFATVSNTSSTVVIKNIAATISTGRLDGLQDVVSAGEVSGAVPVYDATTDKYIIERLNLSDVDGSLDGGDF